MYIIGIDLASYSMIILLYFGNWRARIYLNNNLGCACQQLCTREDVLKQLSD